MTDTSQQISKFKDLIEKSDRILVTSHISPDPDSVCSILLLGKTLQMNFPSKQIMMLSEELPDDLDFLPNFREIKSLPLVKSLDNVDLIIIVDAMNFERCSRKNAEEVRQIVKERGIKLAIIDHHEPVGVEDNEVYINQSYPAAAQEVYSVCFKHLNLKNPEHYAEITMVGLYSDTAGFTYLKDNFQETLDLESELLNQGVKIEHVKNKLSQYKLSDTKVMAEILANIHISKDYTYSFLSDEFVKSWLDSGKSASALQTGIKLFTDNFIRNINGKKWGFTVYKDPRLDEGFYSVSFRSLSGVVDVAEIAGKLGGGGHKPAAGAKVRADNVQGAIQKVKDTIEQGR